MMDVAPEVAFRLAAQPIVSAIVCRPVGTCATNVVGTVHLLEAMRKTASVRALVCVTTDKCYQNQGWIWPYREIDPLGGHCRAKFGVRECVRSTVNLTRNAVADAVESVCVVGAQSKPRIGK
jgi:nucleoside-diphosphate-sugar epimerase